MRFLKCFAMMTCLLISATYAQDELETDFRFKGKHYTIIYKLEPQLQTIRMYGEILSTLVEDMSGFNRVLKLIRKDVPVKLVLFSGGGYLKSYERLPKIIKKNCNSEVSDCRITTIVPGHAYCASACLNIFMIGDERIAGKSSRFGFHQGAAVPGVLKLPGFAQKTLIKSGVDRIWLENNKELFSSLEISWRYPNRLEGSNIVTGLSEAYEY